MSVLTAAPTKNLQQGGERDVEPMGLKTPFDTPPNHEVPRERKQWSNRDVDDATRIGVMIGGYLAAEPFRSEAAFQERVTSMLRGARGPKFGAVKRMKYIMSATMVKHG